METRRYATVTWYHDSWKAFRHEEDVLELKETIIVKTVKKGENFAHFDSNKKKKFSNN